MTPLRVWEVLERMEPKGKLKLGWVSVSQPRWLPRALGGLRIFLWVPGWGRKEKKSKPLSGCGKFCGLVQNQNQKWERISCPMAKKLDFLK